MVARVQRYALLCIILNHIYYKMLFLKLDNDLFIQLIFLWNWIMTYSFNLYINHTYIKLIIKYHGATEVFSLPSNTEKAPGDSFNPERFKD